MFLWLLYINHLLFSFCLTFYYNFSIPAFLLQFLHQAQPSAKPFNAVLSRGHEAWCYCSVFLVVSIISTLYHQVYLYKHWWGRLFYNFKLTLLYLNLFQLFDICSWPQNLLHFIKVTSEGTKPVERWLSSFLSLSRAHSCSLVKTFLSEA